MLRENRSARTAGWLYILYITVHVFADLIGRANIIVIGNPAASARNILNSPWLYRIGYMADISAALIFLLAAWALFVLLRSVNKNLALLFLLLNAVGVAIQCFSDLFLVAGELLLNGPEYLQSFTSEQLQEQAMFFMIMHKNTFMVAQIFYGAWLFPLGYVVVKSGFLPSLLGFILMIHSVFWTMTFFQFFLFPDFSIITFVSYPLGFIAEFGLSLWLVIAGVTRQQQKKSIEV